MRHYSKPAFGRHLVLFARQRFGHLLHARVGVTVRRATVNVVTVLRVRHDEHTDVRDGAKVGELTDLVLDEPRIDDCID